MQPKERRLPAHLQNRFGQQPVQQTQQQDTQFTQQQQNQGQNAMYQNQAPNQFQAPNQQQNQQQNQNNQLNQQTPSQVNQIRQQGTIPQQGQSIQPTTNTKKPTASGKIDTESIPRPIITPDQSINPRKFTTSDRVSFVPQVCTNFITSEDGNSGPRFIRSSLHHLAHETNNTNQTNIPFGLIVQPFADITLDEDPVMCISSNQSLFRCQRCRAYVNSQFQFKDNGQTAVCNLCKMSNKISDNYYSQLNEFGERKDKYQRPELHKGTYEYLAPKEYNNKDTGKNILLMICIEMSAGALMNGLFDQVLQSVQSTLDFIPSPETTEICIMTFDQQLCFYKLPKDLSNEVQMLQISDLEDAYSPLPKSELFINLSQGRDKIDYLIEKLQKIALQMQESYSQQKQPVQQFGIPIGSVLNTASQCMIESGHVGRIIGFSQQVPIKGYGVIKKREDSNYTPDNEKNLYKPQHNQYELLGNKCLEAKIGIDLFVFAKVNEYYDIATIAPVCSITGGQLYYYNRFDINTDSEKLHYDIYRNLSRFYAYDCVMTVRASDNIILQEYYTGLGKVQTRDLEFSTVDADKSISIILKQEDKIQPKTAGIQYAILYTNQSGQRIIRIINLHYTVSNDLTDLYKGCDVDAAFHLLMRKYLGNFTATPLMTIQNNFTNQLVNILHNYRNTCAQDSVPSQLILPEGLKLLPLYTQCAFKSILFSSLKDIKPDERFYLVYKFFTDNLYNLNSMIYPRLYQINDIINDSDQIGELFDDRVRMPKTLALSSHKMDISGMYLFDNADVIYIYVFREVDQFILQQALGVSSFEEVEQLQGLPMIENSDLNQKIHQLIDQLRKNKNSSYQMVQIVTDKNAYLDKFVQSMLMEEPQKRIESYGDFLCKVHKLIQEKDY